MRDVYVRKGVPREKNNQSFSTGENQMINAIKYILVFLKYFVLLNPWNAEVKNPSYDKNANILVILLVKYFSSGDITKVAHILTL